jgi:hypothetical protein
MMIKKIVGKCFIFAGIFILACAIMGGGQADAGCDNITCSTGCHSRFAPCGDGGCRTIGVASCWDCTCERNDLLDIWVSKWRCHCHAT